VARTAIWTESRRAANPGIIVMPAGGACTAVLVVDMTAVPFVWDQGREKPGAVALAESPRAEHVLRSRRSRPLAPSRASTRAERVRFCKSKHTYARKQVNYDQGSLRTPLAAAMTTCSSTGTEDIIACKLICS
jgi:hypothetical protein